jgi:hypothetical protein
VIQNPSIRPPCIQMRFTAVDAVFKVRDCTARGKNFRKESGSRDKNAADRNFLSFFD